MGRGLPPTNGSESELRLRPTHDVRYISMSELCEKRDQPCSPSGCTRDQKSTVLLSYFLRTPTDAIRAS